MRVHWTNRALEHLLAIYEYIAKDSEHHALRMVDRLTERSEKIADFPKIGRKVSEYEDEKIREVFEEPYKIDLSYLTQANRCFSRSTWCKALAKGYLIFLKANEP